MTGAHLHKVIYKPDTQSTEEYMIIVSPDDYKKWKDGDTTIPLAQVVESFDVFHSGQGHQGKLGKASKQQLETIFGTSRDDDVIKFMLEKGHIQNSGEILTGGMDKARPGAFLDTRGSGSTLRGV